jgi:hypothetical protein
MNLGFLEKSDFHARAKPSDTGVPTSTTDSFVVRRAIELFAVKSPRSMELEITRTKDPSIRC